MSFRAEHRWIVAQIGSRELYAVPRAFYRTGELGRLFTDVWIGSACRLVGRLPFTFSTLAARAHSEIPSSMVKRFNVPGIAKVVLASHRAKRGTRLELFDGYNRTGEWFAKSVVKSLRRWRADPARDRVFAFSTGGLEILRWASERGIPNLIDQLDPAQADEEMVAEEVDRWPGWEILPGRPPASYYDRLAAEWACADRILVNSDWSKSSLLKQGVSENKITVVPLTYEPETDETVTHDARLAGPLTVLWLGQVVLRKGIPYFLEAARLLERTGIKFVVAGRLGIVQTFLTDISKNVHVLGRVSRTRALRLFQNADVFVLPTLSDGFALTQLEAMSYGLPVITTPNCGDVVTSGVDGFIVPIRDAAALAEAILKLDRDRALLRSQSVAAVAKSKMFTLERYATSVNRCLDTVNLGGAENPSCAK